MTVGVLTGQTQCESGVALNVTCATGASSITCIPPGDEAFLYAQARFVDPVNGNDAAVGEGADITDPLQTLQTAVDLIAAQVPPPSEERRFVIWLFPGGTVDTDPITWSPWISLFGYGSRTSTVRQDIVYTGAVAEESTAVFSNLEWVRPAQFVINVTRSINVELHVVSSELMFDWNGQTTLYDPLGQNNDLFFESSTVVSGIVRSGAVHAYDSFRLGGVSVEDGQSAFLEVDGGLVSGLIQLTGAAVLITRGVEWIADVEAFANGGVAPLWETDSSSVPFQVQVPPFPAPPIITGPVTLLQEDERPFPVSTPTFQVQLETVLIVDASGGSVNITLPAPSAQPALFATIAREVIVKKVDASANVVRVRSPIGLIDGEDSVVLTAQYQYVGVISDGDQWYVVRQGPGAPL